MIRLLDENVDALCAALKTDLHKNQFECKVVEMGLVRADANLTLKNLDTWARPQAVKKNLMTMMDGVEIIPEPYGVALIIGAWNYPIQLPLLPLVGAIGAGNCVVIKPSEVAEASAKVLTELIPKYLDPECFPVVSGGVADTTALLEERFDYIFYTGSSMVGRIVYQAAAKHLTPVTLELGGKSPCYVAANSSAHVVARRIAWGKFMNSGQTCVAPDYVLCQEGFQDQLVSSLKKTIEAFYEGKPLESDSYGCMVNKKHYERVKELLSKSGKVAIGGDFDDATNKIAPTVLVDVKLTDPIMDGEIFGPVLPIITVADEDEAIAYINSGKKPLALYIFTNDQTLARKVIANTSSGGVAINDTMMQGSVPSLPFGGVGNSGIGKYHGKHTFDTFSHQRACVNRSQMLEKVNDLRCPPHSDRKSSIVGYLTGEDSGEGRGVLSFIPLIVLSVIVAYLIKSKL